MTFISDDFLLETPEARKLYHEYVAGLPIIDYHNHLSPERIAANRPFRSLTEAWLEGDHYKWRAMRTLGVTEDRISGDATDPEKFAAWAACVPDLVRNPLYHWTHMELQRYFGIRELLSPDSADSCYREANAHLGEPGHFPQALLSQMDVEVVCTTDDPSSALSFHRQFREEGISGDGSWKSPLPPGTPESDRQESEPVKNRLQLRPTFRPDRAFALADPSSYRSYLEELGNASGMPIEKYDDLLQALESRIQFFSGQGCRLSDHGLHALPYFKALPCDAESVFRKTLEGSTPSKEEQDVFTFQLLSHLSGRYHHYGWVQQFHLGALRNTNPRVFARQGPDSGCDSIGDFPQAVSLAGFLGKLEAAGQLPKTILYNLNPAWNEVFATMAGNFNGGGVRGKVQFGSGWWYNDQLDGMTRQLEALSNMGVLSTFVGMLTDSRSLLSFPRHEYFRRLLCNLFGQDVARGRLPSDFPHLGSILRDICYFNAKSYFNFDKTQPAAP